MPLPPDLTSRPTWKSYVLVLVPLTSVVEKSVPACHTNCEFTCLPHRPIVVLPVHEYFKPPRQVALVGANEIISRVTPPYLIGPVIKVSSVLPAKGK